MFASACSATSAISSSISPGSCGTGPESAASDSRSASWITGRWSNSAQWSATRSTSWWPSSRKRSALRPSGSPGAVGGPVRPPTAKHPRSRQVEPIEVHHLRPRRDEVPYELLARVVAGVDLGHRPQLGVRAEHEVGAAAGPLQLAGGPVATLVLLGGAVATRYRGPDRVHVEQIDEEVVGQRPGPVREESDRRAPGVGPKCPKTPDQYGHLGSAQ